jgi:hypothetical protein
VFSWIQTLMLRPLPGVPDQERLMVLAGQTRAGDLRAFSVPDVRDLQAADLPVSVAAFDMQAMNLAGRERPERVWAALVTGDLFDVLDVRPVLGREIQLNNRAFTVVGRARGRRRGPDGGAARGVTIMDFTGKRLPTVKDRNF